MTDADPPAEAQRDQLREEAASWFARMRSDDAHAYQPAFEAWLARGAAHRAAYNRIGEVFAAAKIMKSGTLPPPEVKPAGRRSWQPAIVTSVVLAAVLTAVGVSMHQADHRPQREDGLEQSSPFAIRSVPLPGAGQALLDAGAQLATSLSGDPAFSRLERGRARFVFAAARPAHVLAGNSDFRSIGGSFDLWLRRDGSIDAQPIAGDLEMVSALPASAALRRLTRLVVGQHYVIAPDGVAVGRLGLANLDWPSGILEYHGAPLQDVVDEANRYSATKILVADPTLGARRISGRFRVSDPHALALRLAAALSVELDDSQPGRIILLSSKKSSSSP